MSGTAAAKERALEETRRGWLAQRALGRRRRIALALAVSLALHVLMLSGVGMPEIDHVERSEGPPIAARIAPLAPASAPEAPAAAPPPPAAKPRPKPKPRQIVDASAKRPATVPAQAAPPPAPQAEAPAPEGEPRAQAQAEPAKPEPPAAESPAPAAPPAEEPIAFPQRIELEFDIAKSADHAPMGRVVHRFERDGARYLIRSESFATGIAVLFATGRYVQESRGTITAQGLRPDHFFVRRGRAERTESAAFDWAGARATVSAGGASREWALQAGAQDQLSLLHQLSFLIGQSAPPPLMVTNGRRFFTTTLEILGRETVATGLGPVSALQVRSQLEGESRMNVWLAPDYGNLPVKLRVRDRRGEEFEQVLAAMRVQ